MQWENKTKPVSKPDGDSVGDGCLGTEKIGKHKQNWDKLLRGEKSAQEKERVQRRTISAKAKAVAPA